MGATQTQASQSELAGCCACHVMFELRLHVSPCRLSAPLLCVLCCVLSVWPVGVNQHKFATTALFPFDKRASKN